MAALFSAKQVPGAANLQIERGNTKPAAEIAEFLDSGQTLARDGRERFLRWNEQVGIRRSIGPPHAPAQLIELRQTVPIGGIDDDGVRVWNVEPVLDNRRRQEDVEVPLDETEHRALELVFADLTVADDDPCFRDKPL